MDDPIYTISNLQEPLLPSDEPSAVTELNDKTAETSSTYSTAYVICTCVAGGGMGLFAGVSSQIGLYVLFFRSGIDIEDTIFDNPMVFSLVWSVATVLWSALMSFPLWTVMEKNVLTFLKTEAICTVATLLGVYGVFEAYSYPAGLASHTVNFAIFIVSTSVYAMLMANFYFHSKKDLDDNCESAKVQKASAEILVV